ncbi:hypothetical protein CJ739_4021 [Mariniflexile rhizosphaerae]|uniref:hypothetical protein n=1 Tax=unclassified Mariniflexile TaxID=2643887 RepID=UPI000CB1E8AF|nr:hypothetical protein [Mariniflexile sp. TRM1-10]AXP83079.1 hypothetical protein CJ739_4021 [Mariniflexile sp. TRM1-10]PLB19754.1 MAG: hypothetical protein TRG1_1534 [Flavobacteriaceae bacterium FS1-H7996/R]
MSINCIKNIFDGTSIIPSAQDEIIIRETDNNVKDNSLKKVKIKGINNPNLVCFKLDKYVPLTKYFNSINSDGINKGVDAVIFYIKDGKGYILFIELKSFTLNQKDVSNKFFASTAFIHQIGYLAKNIYGKNIHDFSSSAIVFSLNSKNDRVNKFGMRPDIPTVSNKSYSNSKSNIQVLEIQKNNGENFNISMDCILTKARHKELKNWP